MALASTHLRVMIMAQALLAAVAAAVDEMKSSQGSLAEDGAADEVVDSALDTSEPTVVGDGSEDDTWILGLMAVMAATLLAWLLKPEPEQPPVPARKPTPKQDMTLAQLRKYDGRDGGDIYVAVKGKIFNVSSHPSGVELYGGDSPYNVFAGREATIGLARGNYDIEEEYDLDELGMFEYDNLEQWYHWTFMAKYDEVGMVIPDPNAEKKDKEKKNKVKENKQSAENSKGTDTDRPRSNGETSKDGGAPTPGTRGFTQSLLKAGRSVEDVEKMRARFKADSSRAPSDNSSSSTEEFSTQQKKEEEALLRQFGASM